MGQKKGLGPRLYPFARCTGKETVLWLRHIKQLICTALAQTTSTENQIIVSLFFLLSHSCTLSIFCFPERVRIDRHANAIRIVE